MAEEQRYSWTQPVCGECWRERNPQRLPHRVRGGDLYLCCYCGGPTTRGIFVRVNPLTVPYPQ